MRGIGWVEVRKVYGGQMVVGQQQKKKRGKRKKKKMTKTLQRPLYFCSVKLLVPKPTGWPQIGLE